MLAATVFATLVAAITPQALPPLNVPTIIARMEQHNPSLQTFQARVHVDIHMKTFPWLAPQLDGTAYYKRPDNYEVVFDRVPSYAKGINKLFGDIDDPAGWQRDSNISYDGVKSLTGHQYLTLRMTKKIYSDQLADAVAYLDPISFQVALMEWHYRNGGIISMTQTFKQQGAYSVVATQHADIRIPRVHAVADAAYGQYQTNVAVNDAVFTKK